MLIDAHTHVFPESLRLGKKQDGSVDSFLEAFDASPLDMAVLLPIEPIIPNEFVFDAAAKRPGKLLCFGSVYPARGEACFDELTRLASEHGIRGVKFHSRHQHITMDDMPLMEQLFARATELGLPVLFDALPYGKHALHDPTLELVAALSDAVPEGRLIIAHMGGHCILDALVLARSSYNIYLDVSLILSVYRGSHVEQDIFYAIRRLGPERCIYGSDYPDVGLTESLGMMRRALTENGFSQDEQAWVFGKTAAQVLGIEEERQAQTPPGTQGGDS